MDFVNSLLGRQPAPVSKQAVDSGKLSKQPQAKALLNIETDFADFASAPSPVPVSIPGSPADAQAAQPTGALGAGKPYTKWYRVWERTTLSDFYVEGVLVPFLLLAIIVHFWGTRANTKKAKKWMAVHAPVLESEFALVGFSRIPKAATDSPVISSDTLLQACAKLGGENLPDGLLQEKTGWEYESYASGRQNVAFVDIKILLHRRMNPVFMIVENVTGMYIESVKPKAERMEAIMYAFDGKEKEYVPPPPPGSAELEKAKPVGNSAYDHFIFAIVNKNNMRRLRDERYDLSLTFTKEHAKLPTWVTVMSESAEITDAMLTKELISAVEAAGNLLEYLIVTDQPIDKPTTLDETTPKKRIHISMKLPSDGNYLPTLPLFQAFLRLPDYLTTSARFRPEVIKKVNVTRDNERAKIKKVSEKEVEEERLKQIDKLKKEERDRKMKGMSAEDQRKFLERENERNRKKQEKKMTKKG